MAESNTFTGPPFAPMPGMIIEYTDKAELVRSPLRFARLRQDAWSVGFEGASIPWANVVTVWNSNGECLWMCA